MESKSRQALPVINTTCTDRVLLLIFKIITTIQEAKDVIAHLELLQLMKAQAVGEAMVQVFRKAGLGKREQIRL
jgi:hypothetical protein